MSVEAPSGERGAATDDKAKALAERRGARLEMASVTITSAAAVATSWAAFQAAQWSGHQAFALSASQRAREHETRARIEGDQKSYFDGTLFVAYVGAYARNEDEFGTFLHDRFPQRLKNAVDAWLATNPRVNKDAPLTPFKLKEYHIDEYDRADAFAAESDAASQKAHVANRISDTYVLGSVVLATVILMASIGPRLGHLPARRLMLSVSIVGLLLALAWVATLPVARIGQ
jgi:hypothetical protein